MADDGRDRPDRTPDPGPLAAIARWRARRSSSSPRRPACRGSARRARPARGDDAGHGRGAPGRARRWRAAGHAGNRRQRDDRWGLGHPRGARGALRRTTAGRTSPVSIRDSGRLRCGSPATSTNPLLGASGRGGDVRTAEGGEPDESALTRRASRLVRRRARGSHRARASARRRAPAPRAGPGSLCCRSPTDLASVDLVPGVELVMDETDLAGKLATADLVVTGEGRIDEQTAFGKTALGVARRAAASGVPCIAVGGGVTPEGIAALAPLGVVVVPVSERPQTVEEAMAAAIGSGRTLWRADRPSRHNRGEGPVIEQTRLGRARSARDRRSASSRIPGGATRSASSGTGPGWSATSSIASTRPTAIRCGSVGSTRRAS